MEHYDLAIIGTGSGNSVPGPEMDDWRIAVVEESVFGGTCLNRGCIPSKMFVYAADVAEHVRHASKYGLSAELTGVDWPAIVDRVFGRIDPIAEGGKQWRSGLDNVDVHDGRGTFVEPGVLAVGDRRLTASKWVLATGARPFVPDIPGLAEAGFHTSDSIMRLTELPKRLTIIGGGYIAAELGHVFGAFGVEVTYLLRSEHLLRDQDRDVSVAATAVYAERFDVRGGVTNPSVRRDASGVHVDFERNGIAETVSGDEIPVAVGRVPNSDTLDVAAAGIDTHPDGRVVVDETLRTSVDNVWALGDLTNPFQLKHVANHEAKVVAHNLLHPDSLRTIDHRFVPAAVFGSPQIASVGAREQDLEAAGVDYVAATTPYAHTAYGWAMEDTTSFMKLLMDPASRQLLGAHVMGPQASTLIQQLIQGMRFSQTVDEMATGQMYIHPALSEVTENALLAL